MYILQKIESVSLKLLEQRVINNSLPIIRKKMACDSVTVNKTVCPIINVRIIVLVTTLIIIIVLVTTLIIIIVIVIPINM